MYEIRASCVSLCQLPVPTHCWAPLWLCLLRSRRWQIFASWKCRRRVPRGLVFSSTKIWQRVYICLKDGQNVKREACGVPALAWGLAKFLLSFLECLRFGFLSLACAMQTFKASSFQSQNDSAAGEYLVCECVYNIQMWMSRIISPITWHKHKNVASYWKCKHSIHVLSI